MKRMNTLGCPDKPCDCGCPNCNEEKASAPSIILEVSSESVSSGYKKPSAEDYLNIQEAKPMTVNNSEYAKKAAPEIARLAPSGYNKKEIVKVQPVKETVFITKACEKPKEDHTGFYIAGLGLLLLLGLLCRDDDEKKQS